MNTDPDKKPAIIAGHQQGYVLAWPDGKDQILRFDGQEGDESDDSLYDILTGRTPVPPLRHSGRDSRGSDRSASIEREEEYADDVEAQMEAVRALASTDRLDDTFRERREAKSRGRSVLDESGLDEMF